MSLKHKKIAQRNSRREGGGGEQAKLPLLPPPSPLAVARDEQDNTVSRSMQGLRGSQLIWVARCSTPYDTPTFYASRVQAVCRTAHWAVG